MNRNAFRQKLRDNGLGLAMLFLFVTFMVGLSIAGFYNYNEEQQEHGQETVSYIEYLGTSHFAEATFENWESEFLQMAALVILSAFLFQKGSAESNPPEKGSIGYKSPSEKTKGIPWGARVQNPFHYVYAHSLSIALGLIFVISFFGHAVSGAREFCNEGLVHGGECVSWIQYIGTSQFWFESFQNWQSEFLAAYALIVLSIYLRQKGSSQSKEVDAPHSETPA